MYKIYIFMQKKLIRILARALHEYVNFVHDSEKQYRSLSACWNTGVGAHACHSCIYSTAAKIGAWNCDDWWSGWIGTVILWSLFSFVLICLWSLTLHWFIEVYWYRYGSVRYRVFGDLCSYRTSVHSGIVARPWSSFDIGFFAWSFGASGLQSC